jgi:hypothetical protein
MQSIWAIYVLSQGHMGAPLYHYTGQVVPDLEILGCLWSENDVITSCLRLISWIHIRHMQSVWAISMISHGHMGAPLYCYTGQLAPDLGMQIHFKRSEMMSLFHVWGWYPPQTTSCIQIRHIQSVGAIALLFQRHLRSPLYLYTSQVGPRFGNSCLLVE